MARSSKSVRHIHEGRVAIFRSREIEATETGVAEFPKSENPASRKDAVEYDQGSIRTDLRQFG